MEINTLVRHKKLRSLGIGCVSKVLSKSLKVNFGTDDCISTKESQLELVNTSECKTISFQDFKTKSICNSFKEDQIRVIVGNEIKEYVGIGWISLGIVTEVDLTKYPRVI